MNRTTLAALAALLLAGCSGSGNATPPAPTKTAIPAPVASGTASPTPSPSSTPTATASPTFAPTASPVPLALRVMGGAPLTATASQLANARRGAQAKTQAQGVENGLPILVESSGMIGLWAGDEAVWVTNAQTSADIPETSGTITPSGNLPIDNPGFESLSCLGQVSAVCIAHSAAWTFGTASTTTKSVGAQTLTIAFSDGTTGTTTDDVYDGWSLACNTGWAYVSGVPVAQATKATSDVYADCVNSNIVFPKGGYVWAQPSPDQYGNTATIFPQFTAAPVFVADISNVSMASIPYGIVFAIQTQDGGYAKVFFQGAGIPGGTGALATSSTGMSLHSNVSGGFDF